MNIWKILAVIFAITAIGGLWEIKEVVQSGQGATTILLVCLFEFGLIVGTYFLWTRGKRKDKTI